MAEHRIGYQPGDVVIVEHKGRTYRGVVGTSREKVFRQPKESWVDAKGWRNARYGPVKVSVLLKLESFCDITTAAGASLPVGRS